MPSRTKKVESNKHAEWIRIRLHLFQKLKQRVQNLLGEESLGMKRYRASYEAEFRKSWKSASRSQLLKSVSDSSLILLGDFHALKQSQKTQLRVLENFVRQSRSRKKTLPSGVLAVEFVARAQQSHLDAFMADQIGESEFLERIEWKKNWGFEWSHYRPLLLWARENRWPVYGINRILQSHSVRALRARDGFAAQVLAEVRAHHSDARIFVIFGDLHLASPHLPREIERRLTRERILKIFQNSESIFFDLIRKGLDLKVDVVRLSETKYCILSVPPWVKWQTFLNTIESHSTLLAGENADSTESWEFEEDELEDQDYTDHVEQYVELISHELGLKVPRGAAEVISAREPLDRGGRWWGQLKRQIPKQCILDYSRAIEESECFYVPEVSQGYLSMASVNNFAEIATSIVYQHSSGWSRSIPSARRNFSKLIWLETIKYFGSKLVNPRRKTDMLKDIQMNLSSSEMRTHKREILQLALRRKLWESGQLRGKSFSLGFEERVPRERYRQAARVLGGMLGEKLYFAYRQNWIPVSTLRQWFERDFGPGDFDRFYLHVLAKTQRIPDPFLSKREKL